MRNEKRNMQREMSLELGYALPEVKTLALSHLI